MPSTFFTDTVTEIPAAWANDVNTLTYGIFGGAQTLAQAISALNLTWAVQNNLVANVKGGTIDNTPIGQTTPAAGTFSSLSLTAQGAGSLSVATVGYVQSQVSGATSTLGTLAYQNANNVAITGGAINNTPIGLSTPAAATFTQVTLAAAPVAGTDVANKQYVDGKIAAIPAVGTIATQNANAVNITGGTIDGVVIGGNVAANANFLTLGAHSINGTQGLIALDGSQPGYLTFGVLLKATTGPDIGVRVAGGGQFHVQNNSGNDWMLLDTQGRLIVNTANDNTHYLQVAGGASIDSVVLSSPITLATQAATKAYVDTAQATAETFATTSVTNAIAALGSMAHQSSSAVSITGGTLDAVTIGATTPAAQGIFEAGQVIAAPVGLFDLANKQYVDGKIAALPLQGTMAFQNANAIAVTGGHMDNVVIGATTPATAFFLAASAHTLSGPIGEILLDGSELNYFAYGVVLKGMASGPNVAVKLGSSGAFHVRTSLDADLLTVTPAGRVTINTTDDANNYLQVSGGIRTDSLTLSSPITIATQAATKAYVDTSAANVQAGVAAQITSAINALGSMSKQAANSVQITGGTIDGTVIGSTNPTTASFTTVSVSQTLGNATGKVVFNQVAGNQAVVLQALSTTKPNIAAWVTTGGSFQVINGTQTALAVGATGRSLFGFGATDDGLSVLQVNGQAAVSGQLLIPQAPSGANSAANKAYVDAQIASVSGSTVTPAYVTNAINNALIPYATQTYVNNAVAGFVTQSYVTAAINAALAPYATQVWVNNAITSALSTYATQTYVNQQITTALGTYATQAWVTSQLSNYADFTTLAASTGAGLIGYGTGTVKSTLDSLTVTAQAPNLVYATPAAAPNAAPSFRALVTADLPATINSTSLTTSSLTATGTVAFTSTGAIQLPTGNTAARPSSPTLGMFRFNTDAGRTEFYGGSWTSFLPLTGGSITGALTATGQISAAGFATSSANYNTAYAGFTPVSGATINVVNTTSYYFIDPAATIAALTVDLPAVSDGLMFTMTFSKAVTTITWVPTGTPPGSDTMGTEVPTTVSAGQVLRFLYRQDTKQWRLI